MMDTTRDSITGMSLPRRDRKNLTLVSHDRTKMRQWVHNLPIMNAAECGKQLYQTITELSTLDIDADLRFDLIEILQPTARNLIRTLEKNYLNQPIILSNQGRRVFALAWALRRALALNYKIVAIEALQKLQKRVGIMAWGKRGVQQLAASATERTLLELQALLLDHYRQYEDTPAGVWADIHSLCRVADAQGLTDIRVKIGLGREEEETSIRHTYLRAMMLVASQPNKLRPNEMELLYRHSDEWAKLLTLNSTAEGSLLVCNLDDNPPLYHHRSQSQEGSWYIHARAFADYLQQQIAQTGGTFPLGLLKHLQRLWSEPQDRMFGRQQCHRHILLCLGMSSAHYYAGNQTRFKVVVLGEEKQAVVEQPKFLFGLDEGEVLEEQPDAWQVCYGAVSAIDDESDDNVIMPPVPEMTYMPYRVTAENRSPAGYGLQWPEDPPAALRVGEIIGMSEHRGQGWGIGVLHWLHKTPDQMVEAGVELLSAHPKPCGVCLVKHGHQVSEFMRGFLIPEMKSVERKASLIVPSSGLASGSTVRVSLHGQDVTMQLTDLILATQSINQFEFAIVNTDLPPVDDGLGDLDDIDSLWARL